MKIYPVKTNLIQPGQDVFEVFVKRVRKLKEGDIIVIASKVVALQQKRIIDACEFKKTLKKEAQYVSKNEVCPNIYLTIKDGILIPNAGIDFSNIEEGKAILWPKNSQKEAEEFRAKAKKKYKIKRLGVMIADSHCQPLRKGTTAVALAAAGFEPVKDERNKRDLFGRKLKVTQMAVADSLATAANLIMGEGKERTPIVIISDAKVAFTNKQQKSASMIIQKGKCLFRELYVRI